VSTSEGTRRTSVTRWTLGLLGPAVLLAIAFLPWAALWSRLPDPVAVHWDLSGRSDASQARGSVVWEAGAIVAVLSAGLAITVVVATRKPREPIDVAWPAGLLSFFGALLAAASATTTLANADADGWRDAELPPWWAAVVVAVALVGGWSGARLGARLGTARPVAPDGASTMPLDPGELVAWSGRCTAMRGASAYGVVTLLAAVATAVGLMGPRSVLIPLVVVSVPLLALFSVRVTAGAHGLKVRSGAAPWPAVRIPLDRIARVRAMEVKPSEWGGWGYRGSLRLLRRAAWVLRRGDGIVVDLRDGRRFAVTVDDAEAGASVLSALVARREAAPASGE
jgi:hypothetical protein